MLELLIVFNCYIVAPAFFFKRNWQHLFSFTAGARIRYPWNFFRPRIDPTDLLGSCRGSFMKCQKRQASQFPSRFDLHPQKLTWVFPKIRETPQNGWFIMDGLEWMIWGYPYFMETPTCNPKN